MTRPELFPQIIDDLYAGTLDEIAWRRAIVAVADVLSGAAIFIFCVDPSTATVLRDEYYRFDLRALEQYRKFWFAKDIRVGPAQDSPVGEPEFDSGLMPVREWKRTEVYNEFLEPNDSPWFLTYILHKAPSRIVNVSINSTRLRGPFDEHDGERLRPLIPHLRRALEIKDRLESQHIRHDTVVKCLDNACVAVVLLDEGGRVVEASSSAAALMCASNGIDRDADGTLWVRGPAGVVLNEWITKGMPPARNGDGLLHIPRPPSGPLSIMVTRLPVMSTPWLSGSSPCWMLLLFDPDRQVLASAELIARDLGLSLREAELAAMLVNACDITVVAQRLHISINTARTHLKSIYSKTGIGSQAELVRRITSGPAGRRTGG